MPSPEAPRPFGIVDVLRLKIVSGEYPEGAKLPGETALAGHLQASRSTVRRALVELGREGLVSAARGRGTFVRVRPDKRVIVIGDQSPHEDLLDEAYQPTRRGWTPVWPTRIAAPMPASPPPSLPPSLSPPYQQGQQAQQMQQAQQAQFLRRVTTQVRDARIVGCNSAQAAALGLTPKQPIMLRDQRWRHQENGYVIALSSFAPTSLFSIFADGPRTVHGGKPVSARPDRIRPASEGSAGRRPESEGPASARPENDGGVAVYPELIRDHGPATFSASVKARMPSVREREELEMETGVPLLIVTRTMLDPSGHPLEATLVHVPADRFEVAHVSRKPILSL